MDAVLTSRTLRSVRADHTTRLLSRIAHSEDRKERSDLMDQVVVLNMCVAEAVASRYRSRGVATEDLLQVAYLALVKSVQGYDDTTGNNFLSYAVPTIRGEIRRYFRDLGWMVRPPRRIQELQLRISRNRPDLVFSLGRAPTPSEIAEHLGEDLAEVNEALSSEGCFTPVSLDRAAGEDGTTSLGELIHADGTELEAAETRATLLPVVRRLDDRDRRILTLRFIRGWTQTEIAEDIGVTQMQVSRLLTRILADLRTDLGNVS